MVGYTSESAMPPSDETETFRNSVTTSSANNSIMIDNSGSSLSGPANPYEAALSASIVETASCSKNTSVYGADDDDDDDGYDPLHPTISGVPTYPPPKINGVHNKGNGFRFDVPPPSTSINGSINSSSSTNTAFTTTLASASAAIHGYAGFNNAEMEPPNWHKPKKDFSLPLSISISTSSQPTSTRNATARHLSPVSTKNRRMAYNLLEERKERQHKRRVDGVSSIVNYLKTGVLPLTSAQAEAVAAQLEIEPDPDATAAKRQKLVGTALPNESPVVLPTSIDRAAAGSSANESGEPVVLPTVRVQDLLGSMQASSSKLSRNGQQLFGPDDIPPQPPHPTDPDEIRRLMRSKMLRCKRCKNRFVERCLYERHLKEKHNDDYIIYMAQQEAEMDAQRREELEQMKHEEIQCGGYIPPASEVDSSNFSNIDANSIPLPGEQFGGQTPRFDRWGGIKLPRHSYKKKVSPQCPFCDKRFRNENSLKKHIAKKHPDGVNFVQCNNCYKSIKNQSAVDNHTCELTYICYECVPIRNLCTENRLNNHRAKFHRGANSGFRCNECHRKFLTPRKLRKHKKMAHVVTKPFKCHFCDEFFPTETQVSLHERIHTGKVKYECNICDFRANRYPKLEKHKRDEHGYMCCICQEKMAEWAELKHHTLDKHGGYMTSERGARYVESPRVWILFVGE